MVRSKLIILSISLWVVSGGVHASQNASVPDKPVDRGYGQHDACFGDKYESDEDMKTGNEKMIEDILKLLDTPGT